MIEEEHVEVKVLTDVEQERDMAWLRTLLMKNLKLNAGDWFFILAVSSGTVPPTKSINAFLLWDHILVSALMLSCTKYGIKINIERKWTSVEDQWRDLCDKILKYWKLVGRLPADN